ncbi:OmpA family protein [Halpernia humi]|uniref:OmpA family protein n=1 Tax=Halpernia humi TaxID=493375 RepID=A0A1H5SRI6_9FLAO|nr:OmpA family protein [Halpernia humi]SEF52451.1 OmpA family protein [Halpernia humi]
MALDIIDLIKGQIGPAVISQASTHLGESESSVSKAITALLPTIVGGLANNADKSGVLDTIMSASSSNILGNLMGDSHTSMITNLLTSLFGDKIDAITNSISSFSGVSNASSSSLLNMVTAAAVGSIGKYATENNLGTSGLSSLLSHQKDGLSSLLPAGLSLASLGLGHLGSSEKVVVPEPENITVTTHDGPKVDVTKSGDAHVNVAPENNDDAGSIWKWLLPLILLLAAGWWIWNQYQHNKMNPTKSDTDSTMMKSDSANTSMMKDSTDMNTSAKIETDIDLNGVKLKGYANGMEESMIAFLKSGNYKNAANDDALKTTWFNFDHVNFKIGSATELEEGSQRQIDNLVAILKAYPDAKINVGGYTDKSGDEAKNLALSQARADEIKSLLTKAGVGSQVIVAKGYGSEQAKLPATASVADRAVDRKMAVRFTK